MSEKNSIGSSSSSSGKQEGDKLDLLFDKQNELFKKQLKNSTAVNRMKNLYEINKPFGGYRIFML